MGAWGMDSFENDEACDWAADMVDSDDPGRIAHVLKDVAEGDGYLESDTGTGVIVAAEVIARAKGLFGQRDAYTKRVDGWIAAKRLAFPPAMAALALQALARVTSEDSELYEVWQDAGSDALEAWLAQVADLHKRLEAAAQP